ncbi:MAG: diaminopimelate decarboxylase, partial [Solirubrobacteraceae bacterium]
MTIHTAQAHDSSAWAPPTTILPRSAAHDGRGRLTVGGCALADLATVAGTPALIVDEGELRATAREYTAAFT